MRTILFDGTHYPVVEVLLPEGERTIATWNLNEALFTENAEYISIEAQQIDEAIFFYVNENHIRLSNEELALEVSRQMV